LEDIDMEQNERISQQSESWQDIFSGQWKQMRGTLRSWWGKITDDDWERIAGHKDKLLGFLQEKYGYTKDMAQREIERRFREYESWSSEQGNKATTEHASRPNGQEGGSVGQSKQSSLYDSPQEIKQAGKEISQDIKETAANISQKTEDVYNDVKARAQEYGEAATEKMSGASAAMGEKMSSMAKSLRGTTSEQGMIGSAANSVADGLDVAGSYLQENTFENMGRDLTTLIRRYPVQSFFVGLGIGYLFYRRSER